jgi:hypothetical protein
MNRINADPNMDQIAQRCGDSIIQKPAKIAALIAK